ncbi:hypothetical protein JHK85_028620 [Glycine max]|nr:hypothetical protein JHK85_028620 [Glycine max]
MSFKTVLGSIIICTFSAGFNNGTSTLHAIIGTSKALGLEGFILVANPNYGDYIAEPIPFAVSGIMIPRVDDDKHYEEQTKRDRKGTTTEFGAMATVGEGRIASFTGRSPIVRHNFSLLSGTSMSTPHVAGIAALIKQYNPLLTPAMIASAISTTSSKYDNLGEHMMAEGFEASSLLPSTPFEYGVGFVSPNCAIDPGLLLESNDALTQIAGVKLDGTGQLKNILVTAASGGVGHYTDQLAKLILCFRDPEYKLQKADETDDFVREDYLILTVREAVTSLSSLMKGQSPAMEE